MRRINETHVINYVMERGPLLMALIDRDGNVKETNEFTRYYVNQGRTIQNVRELFPEFVMARDIKELAQEPEKTHEFSICTSSGVPESALFNFYENNGEILALGSLNYFEASSVQKKLIEINNEMGVLTRELHKKSAELEKINELKNQFLGMAAHDLRNPILIITSYAGFLSREAGAALGERHREFLASISEAANHMKEMINSLLDVSVIESGNMKLKLEKVSLGALLRSSMRLNELKASQRGIAIILECRDENEQLYADPAKIGQVLDNLIGNALDYTPNNGRVEVTALMENGKARFFVQDYGRGIPEGQTGKLFKPFGKAATVKLSGAKSTGLGLLISRKIVEAHQGIINAYNTPGKGACFVFELPAAQKGGDHE